MPLIVVTGTSVSQCCLDLRHTTTGRHELREWLRLLPFSNRPAEAFNIVRALPEQQRAPDALEDMLDALGHAPGDEAETVLFQLAEADPRFYAHYA